MNAKQKIHQAILDQWASLIQDQVNSGLPKIFLMDTKNFVLMESDNRANASAMIFSISETAKANMVNTYQYFELFLSEIPKHVDDDNLSFLMPSTHG